MARIGFAEITKPGLLQSMGRMMTIRKGSEAKGVPLETTVAAFEAEGLVVKGFTTHDTNKATEKNVQVEGLSESARTQAVSVSSSPIERNVDPEVAARQEELANMIRRLSAGEDLERVRADFVRDFANVSATEITQAEQKLINDGMPIREVQHLCDVHSALFHGKKAAPEEVRGAFASWAKKATGRVKVAFLTRGRPSPATRSLLEELQKRNPAVRIFCGDAWSDAPRREAVEQAWGEGIVATPRFSRVSRVLAIDCD